MKKKIMIILSLMFMIFIMTSCQKETKTYTLTMNYNESEVEVQLTSPNKNGTYDEGKEIKVTVAPKKGYLLASFLVDSEEVTLENGAYTFKITKNTTITVNTQIDEGYTLTIDGNIDFDYDVTPTNSYGKYDMDTMVTLSIKTPTNYAIEKVMVNDEETSVVGTAVTFAITKNTTVNVTFVSTITNISAEALASVQGKVKIAGTYTLEYPDYDMVFSNYIETIFNDDKVHQREYSNDDQKETYNVTFHNNNGYAAIHSIGLDNTVQVNTSKDVFADFDNPFKDLVTTDFELNEEDGYFYLVNNLDETAATITGWNEKIAEFKVKVRNDQIVEISILTQLLADNANDYYMSSYTLEVTEHGTAEVVDVTPYEHVAEHDTLASALNGIGYNYTLTHFDHQEGYEDIEYTSYVGENYTYQGYVENGISYGYLEKEGLVYDFKYDGTTVTIGDPLDVASFKDIQSDFKGFAPELFEYVGNDTFVARTEEIAASVAYLIGYDRDVKMLGTYATALELVVKDGQLYQVKYDYIVYGTTGNVVFTYKDFGTTTCPIPLDNIQQVTIFDTYAGTYTSEDGAHTIIIADQTITIDGTAMVVEGFDTAQGSFYGTYLDQAVEVTRYFGMSELYVTYGDVSFVVSNEALYGETAVPTEYYGTFQGTIQNVEHTIVISEAGIMVDGVKLELLHYEYMVGVVGTLDGVKYYLYIDVDENNNVVCYFLRPDFTTVWILDYVSNN